MFDLHKKLSKNLMPFVLGSFLLISLFGVGLGIEMKNGQMSSCPFMVDATSLCQMSVTEHISQWQNALLGIPPKSNLLMFALLLVFLLAVPFVKLSSQIRQTESAARFISFFKTAAAKIFDPLLLAFSDGILNPKIYEPAHI